MTSASQEVVRAGDLIIDRGRFCVSRNGIEIPLPRLSFDLLLALIRAAPNALTIEQLMDQIWPGLVVSPETVSQRVKLLRTALGDSAAEPRYIASIRGRGYRLLLPVESMPSEAAPTAAPPLQTSTAEPHARLSRQAPMRRWWAGALAMAGLATMWFVSRDGGQVLPLRVDPALVPAAGPSIAVLPLVNRSLRAEDALVADGIHDDILTRLAQVGGIRVIARTSVDAFRRSTLGVREIGRRLDVKTVLEGSVQRDGDRVRINLQLIDAATEGHLWAENYDREFTAGSLFAMQSEVAQSVATTLQARLTEVERHRLQSVPTMNLEAWSAYQAGQRLLARRSSSAVIEAEKRFDRAIELDPSFALAHVGRANSLILQHYRGTLPTDTAMDGAESSIVRALRLSPDLAEAVTALGGVQEEHGQLEIAEQQYLRAIALNPNYAQAPHWLSVLLMNTGRVQEALPYAESAARLDPYSISPVINYGQALEAVGRWDDALQRHLHALELDPENSITHAQIAGWFATGHGRLDLAIPWLERGAGFDPDNVEIPLDLAALYAGLGWSDKAQAWNEQVMRRHSRLGDLHSAWLAYQAGDLPKAAEFAERARAEFPRHEYPLRILRDADLAAGRAEAARVRYLEAVPDLGRSPLPRATDFTAVAAIDLALVLQRTGDSARARELLAFAARHWANRSRMGFRGFGIEDVRILALQGEVDAAIAALQDAERAGWRAWTWRQVRDRDPALASIRDRPEFRATFLRIERDLAEQRQQLEARLPGTALPRSLPPTS